MANNPKNSPGSEFELRVFSAVKRAIQSGELGLNESSCRAYHRKGYYSAARQKPIITDVSIEVFVRSATSPSILWIWECKDYTSGIPVDDIEEFHAKLEQIGADMTKGTVIGSGWFQRSALQYARSQGIAIARLLPERQIDWTHHSRSDSDMSDNSLIEDTLLRGDARSGKRLHYLSFDAVLGSASFLDAYVAYHLREWHARLAK